MRVRYLWALLILQKGLGKWKVSVDGFQQKIEDIQALLEVPLQV